MIHPMARAWAQHNDVGAVRPDLQRPFATTVCHAFRIESNPVCVAADFALLSLPALSSAQYVP